MQSQAQTPISNAEQPFQILHNFRTKGKQPQKPRRKSSVCQRHHTIPQFTIRTRKMTAQIELKHQLEILDKMNNEEQLDQLSLKPLIKLGEDEEFFLENEEELQNPIPISPQAQKQFLFNFQENSQISTYSKLQKALFGFSLELEKIDQQ